MEYLEQPDRIIIQPICISIYTEAFMTEAKSTNIFSGISILIPCAGRIMLLEKLLHSVHQACKIFQLPSEIILLDNSRVDERGKVRELALIYNAFYHIGSDNLSQKRNKGAHLASYDLILFLDSDCVVDENILHEHFYAYTSPETAGCLGLLNFVGQDTTTWMSVERTGVLECFSIPNYQETTLWGPTANISFRKDLFLDVGGFDNAFSRPGGEDVDLGFRLTGAGWSICCNPAAIAYHTKETWASFWQVYERFVRYGAADALLIKKHPSHTIMDFPMSTQYAVILSVLVFLWFPLIGYWSTLLPFMWAGFSIAIYSSISNQQKTTNQEVAWYIRAQELILYTGLDFGRLIGAFQRQEPKAFYKRVTFFEEQLSVDWTGVSQSSLASILSLFATLLILSLIIQFL